MYIYIYKRSLLPKVDPGDRYIYILFFFCREIGSILKVDVTTIHDQKLIVRKSRTNCKPIRRCDPSTTRGLLYAYPNSIFTLIWNLELRRDKSDEFSRRKQKYCTLIYWEKNSFRNKRLCFFLPRWWEYR